MSADPLLIVTPEEEGQRLDRLLVGRYPDFSRTYFQRLIDQGLVLVNGEKLKKREKPTAGDAIEVEFALTPEISFDPEPIPLTILYEDDDLLAIDKPAGMVVHPAPGNWSGTFVNALLYHCSQLPGESHRPGIVHRLDKETTGVLLAAKTERAHLGLVDLFASRQMKKEYLAICVGTPGNRVIEGNIGRNPKRRKEMTVLSEGGRPAKTTVEMIQKGQLVSYIRLHPQTGRTHQLRVHLKSIGCPILGDTLYGSAALNRKLKAQRQMLHASRLCFTHPITKQEIEVNAPIPDDMQHLISCVF